MSDRRLPKQLLYGELCRVKRSVGGQKKRFKDFPKGLSKTWTLTSVLGSRFWPGSSSLAWQSHQRGPVRQKTDGPLKQRKRAAPKARATFNSIAAPKHSCPMCVQAFWARIGLTSHLRTHHQSSVEVMVIFDFRRTNDNKGPGHTTVQEGSENKYCKANYKSELVIPALNITFQRLLAFKIGDFCRKVFRT